jgi:hypothetical protein
MWWEKVKPSLRGQLLDILGMCPFSYIRSPTPLPNTILPNYLILQLVNPGEL